MWQRFTERARKVVFYAQEEAQRFGEGYVSTEHLLLGLVRESESESVAARVLSELGVGLARVRDEVEKQLPRGDARSAQDMTLTPRAKRVIDLAYDEARNLNNNYIGTEHLLLGLVREGDGLAGRVLAKLGVNLDQTRREVIVLQDADGGPSKRESDGLTTNRAVDPWHAYEHSAKAAIQSSFDEKRRYGHEKVSAEHLLLAIASGEQSLASKTLEELGVTAEVLRQKLEVEFERQQPPISDN
jgi:ATP-dependent Clp protease ATP-binding subunit ClpA